MQRTNVHTPRGTGDGGRNWETGIDIFILLYIKQVTNENLLYSTGNSTQMFYGNINGKEIHKCGDIHNIELVQFVVQ